ncbi:MAG: ABC transporter permease [Anaerolineaceae bacterium]|nr:ABC transporter permease [Anaerolineaceae bacterium]
MIRYIVRRLFTMLLTMLVVSIIVFGVVEIAPGNVARNILGAYATADQEASMNLQLGLTRPVVIRYISWLLGSDWQAKAVIGYPLKEITITTGTVNDYRQWWAVDKDGSLVQWAVVGNDLFKFIHQPSGDPKKVLDNQDWHKDSKGQLYFWGVDNDNRATEWIQGKGGVEYRNTEIGWMTYNDAPVAYIPLDRGLIRGDPGVSLEYKAPVNEIIGRRIQNSAILAALAFLFAMPLGVLLGLIAGLNEGKRLDRILSLGGLVTTASPEFATGIILIIVFGLWLKWLPAASVYVTSASPITQPKTLVLPVLTASLIEIGYILRITRVSVVDVVNSGYVRTAILKGIPYWQVVLRHVLRNSLMAPVTVIMLNVNWLIGGLVVIESVFGYPGLGTFILNAALYKDIASIEAASMVLIVLAVGTQLIADIIYSYLNPRIRFS